ncbi:hypothetical protein F5Y05DRAFT_250244 [Hypoxylon sp. FL0543]|nr:hypothetical protein F5Y05DRAFT_250244 [Hypoxylon sp. FL0543]
MDLSQPRSQLQSHLSPYHHHHQQRRRNGFDRFGCTWGLIKVALTSLSVACCAIVLGISIALAAKPDIKSYVVAWTAPQAGVALVWSGVDLITARIRRQNRRNIHPGAHVAVHLLLWLGFGVGVGLTAYMLAFALVFVGSGDRNVYSEYYDNEHDDGGYDYYTDYYIRSMEALVAFLALLYGLIHISLFARACVETNRLGRARITQRQAHYPMEPLQSARLSEKGEEQEEARHEAM